MPISPAFTASQSALSPSVITLTDTSTGSDAAIANRHVFFQNAQGQYLTSTGTSTTPAYEQWSYSDASKSFTILTEDTSLAITVLWVNSGGTTLYTLTQVFCFSQFNKNFFYYLIQLQGLTPGVIQDSTYFSNISTYWTNIVGAIQAVEIGADIAASQNCLNRATNMMNNQTMYF